MLEKGDVIYVRTGLSDDIGRIRIERTTKTQAICGTYKFKRDNHGDYVDKIGYKDPWNRTTYQIESPKIQELYYLCRLRRELNHMRIDLLEKEKLEKIYFILNGEDFE